MKLEKEKKHVEHKYLNQIKNKKESFKNISGLP